MSTIPFTQVEGSIALPRMRPHERIPPPFGRQWSLRPPHFSLRAELKALYAAVLRTVCLSAEAFRDACRWDLPLPAWPERLAAHSQPPRPAALHAGATPAQVGIPVRLRRPRNPRGARRTPIARNKLAGGACAVGGAALLAWIVASHAPQSVQPLVVASGEDSAARRLALARELHADAQKTAPAAPGKQAQQRAQPASKALPDYRIAARHAAPATVAAAEPGRRSAAASRAKRDSTARPALHDFGPRRYAPPVTTHRTKGTYSTANAWSTPARAARQNDDYDSILTYAATHTGALASAGRAAIPVDSVEWVNHLSQRRVTEVPDQFAR